MSAGKQIQLVSVQDYLAAELDSDIKHEYIGGSVYAMAGARTANNRIATNSVGSMHRQLRGQP
jgi:hypothetical protein